MIGERVKLKDGHSHAGETGLVKGPPGRGFTGWTVLLDSDLYVGASSEQIEVIPARAAVPSENQETA